MNRFLRAACATLFFATAPALLADPRPAITIDQAAALAQGYLRDTGHEKDRWIVSLTFMPETVMKKKFHWYAKWSAPIPFDGRKELGLQIEMDGTLVRSVDKKAPQ